MSEQECYGCSKKNGCPVEAAMHVQRHAAGMKFDWADIEGVLDKVKEEVAEISEAVREGDMDHARNELGDLLFAAFNVARFLDADPLECLCNATQRFEQRFECMVKMVVGEGRALESCSAESLDAYWERVKKLMAQ